jgi:hypothetical protein
MVANIVNAQTEAKCFFVEKVIQRATNEGVSLSAAERWMLRFSESDPEFDVDPSRVDELAAQMSDEEYEAKIAGLLERSLAADIAADAGARKVWQQAHSVLAQGDHYIQIMVDRAVGGSLKRWWEFWR